MYFLGLTIGSAFAVSIDTTSSGTYTFLIGVTASSIAVPVDFVLAMANLPPLNMFS